MPSWNNQHLRSSTVKSATVVKKGVFIVLQYFNMFLIVLNIFAVHEKQFLRLCFNDTYFRQAYFNSLNIF